MPEKPACLEAPHQAMKDIDKLDIRDADGGALLAVKVVPGSSRSRIVGVLGASLKIATSAPAEKGRANAAVARLLAGAFGIDTRSVRLVAGQTRPRKTYQLVRLPADRIRQLLSEM